MDDPKKMAMTEAEWAVRATIIPEKTIIDGAAADKMSGVFKTLTGFQIGDVMKEVIVDDLFLSVGILDSHRYRFKLIAIFDKFGLSNEERFLIIALYSEVGNTERIMTALTTEERFKGKPWVTRVVDFTKKHLVNYVSSAKAMDRFPVVKIKDSFPSVALIAQIAIHPAESYDFYLGLTISAQFNLCNELMVKQKKAEYEFWRNVVTSSKNSSRNKEIELGFHEDYWITKAKDSYPLLDIHFKPVYDQTAVISVEMWEAYINKIKGDFAKLV